MISLERAQEALQQEEARLTAEIAAEMREQRTMGQDTGEEGPGEIGDDASELAEREKSLGLEGTLERMLEEVRRALHKIEDGTYGVCDACGQRIAEERLEVRPQANLCIRCKGQREHVEVLHERRFGIV